MDSSILKFYRNEYSNWDAITTRKIYVDITGDLISGSLLSQIVFWHLPTKEGKEKLKVRKNGQLWLVKSREDWWDEIRITPKQYDRAIKNLQERGLVEVSLFKFNGAPTIHIRVIHENLIRAMNQALDNLPLIEEFQEGEIHFDQRGKWIFPKGKNPISPNGEIHFDQRGKSLTEITTETTKEITTDINDNVSTLHQYLIQLIQIGHQIFSPYGISQNTAYDMAELLSKEQLPIELGSEAIAIAKQLGKDEGFAKTKLRRWLQSEIKDVDAARRYEEEVYGAKRQTAVGGVLNGQFRQDNKSTQKTPRKDSITGGRVGWIPPREI